MARKKTEQPLVVGTWGADGSFKACAQQPEKTITTVSRMAAWVKDNFKDQPGEYSFVRKIPGRLVLAVQQELKLTYDYGESIEPEQTQARDV